MRRPDENDRLTRVGPGTPAGDRLRRYGQAILLSGKSPHLYRPGQAGTFARRGECVDLPLQPAGRIKGERYS